MKREIMCEHCAPEFAQPFRLLLGEGVTDGAPYPEEHVRMVPGQLVADAHGCVCDGCNASISAGSKVWACSMWSDIAGGPYHSWEREYLDVLESVEHVLDGR